MNNSLPYDPYAMSQMGVMALMGLLMTFPATRSIGIMLLMFWTGV